MTTAEWLREARERLAPVTDEGPLEAELLLRHVTGRSRATLVAWPDAELATADLVTLTALLDRRADGEPLAYITGTREFWSLELEMTPAVLIPRPDTETLVERALFHLKDDPDGLVIDVGTGSGAVAIALATECPNPIVATDVSGEALAVAARNAERLLPEGRVSFVKANWLETFADDCASLVVSNPPYLTDDDPHLPALRREPRGALVSGPDGLDGIRTLIDQAERVARRGAPLIVEHGVEQGASVKALFEDGGWSAAMTTGDLAGRDRIGEGRRSDRAYRRAGSADDKSVLSSSTGVSVRPVSTDSGATG